MSGGAATAEGGQKEGGEAGQEGAVLETFAVPKRPVLDPDVEKYQEVLDSKAERVKTLLGAHLPSAVPLEVFGSKPIHYRMRAEFRVWHDGDEANFALFDPVTKEPIKLQQYLLACERINEVMAMLLEEMKKNEIIRKKLFQVELVATTEGEALLAMVYRRKLDEGWEEEAKKLSAKMGCEIIGRSKGKKTVVGRDYIVQRHTLRGVTYPQWQTENRFSQSNAQICSKMLTWAQAELEGAGGGGKFDLLELYCGNGNFTLPLSALFRKVLATELDKYSVRAATACAHHAKVHNVAFASLSAAEATQAFNKEREFFRLRDIDLDSYDFKALLVDPPRAGLDQYSIGLAQKFEEVLYISCNPAKLVQDLEELPDHHIVSAALFDQFPWTDHAEVAVRLKKRGQTVA